MESQRDRGFLDGSGCASLYRSGVFSGKSGEVFGKQKVIVGGFLLWMVGMFLIGLAKETWMLYAFLIPYALGGVAGPTVQGLISNQVSDKEQGNLQGAITGLVSLTAIFGQLIFSPIFYYFVRPEAPVYFPGAPYMLASMIFVVAFICAVAAMRSIASEEEKTRLVLQP